MFIKEPIQKQQQHIANSILSYAAHSESNFLFFHLKCRFELYQSLDGIEEVYNHEKCSTNSNCFFL